MGKQMFLVLALWLATLSTGLAQHTPIPMAGRRVSQAEAPFIFNEVTNRKGFLRGICGDTLHHLGKFINPSDDTITLRVAIQPGYSLSEGWVWAWALGGKSGKGTDPMEIQLKPGQVIPFAIRILTSSEPGNSSLPFLFSSGDRRSSHLFLAETRKAKSATPTEMVEYRKVGKASLRLHVWKPKDWQTGNKRPALLLFHGGGWHRGQPETLGNLTSEFARLGFVAISAEYRLSDSLGTTLRESIDDVFRAMAWIRAHADSLGIDPDRIVAGGGSSGGHLAACLGSLESFRGEDGLKGTLPNALLIAAAPLRLDSVVMRQMSIRLDPEEGAALSPLDHLASHHPPALVLYGGNDRVIPANQPREYVETLEALGVRTTLKIFPDARHAFYNSPANLEKVTRLTLDFLRELGWEGLENGY